MPQEGFLGMGSGDFNSIWYRGCGGGSVVLVLTVALETPVICRLHHLASHRLKLAGRVCPSQASPHLTVNLSVGFQPLAMSKGEGWA